VSTTTVSTHYDKGHSVGVAIDETGALHNLPLLPTPPYHLLQVIGRDDVVRRTIQVLSRRTKNNAVLVGEPGK